MARACETQSTPPAPCEVLFRFFVVLVPYTKKKMAERTTSEIPLSFKIRFGAPRAYLYWSMTLVSKKSTQVHPPGRLVAS